MTMWTEIVIGWFQQAGNDGTKAGEAEGRQTVKSEDLRDNQIALQEN